MLLKTKKEIEDWLNKYGIDNYTLIEDVYYGYVVDVNEGVNLFNKGFKSIEIKFNIVNGDFFCGANKLESLIGCPEIVNGSFYAYKNNLKSLIGAPKIVKEHFNCNDNNLISLKGGPEYVLGGFYCNSNHLTSLVGCPEIIGKDFFCTHNKLSSLIGLPLINQNFHAKNNELKLNNLSQLLLKEMKIKRIYLDNNIELGDLQKINDFNDFQKILNIYQEKADLMKILKVTDKSVESTDKSVENLDILMKNGVDIMNKEITDKSLVKINKI